MTFNTYYQIDGLKSLISGRLYLSESKIEEKDLTYKRKDGALVEQRGLGLTYYFPIVGSIMSLLGYALKTHNERGEPLYINKSSFSHYILRLKKSRFGKSEINLRKMNNLYNKHVVKREDILDRNKVVSEKWDSTKNLHELINNFLKI